MLHILLLILKIIGIILAVILGILVLLLCVVLFVPVRYRAAARCDGTLSGVEADVKVTWFFGLLRVSFRYKDKKPEYQAWAACKKLGERQESECDKRRSDSDDKSKESKDKKVEKTVPEGSGDIEISEEEVKERPCISEKTEQEQEKTDETCREESTCDEAESTELLKGSLEESDNSGKKSGKFQKIKEIIRAVRQFLAGIPAGIQKIKCTFERFCDKIKLLFEKKDKLAEFVEDEAHKSAFFKIKDELFRLLKRLRPQKFVTDLTYGFDDPYLTGKVLAGLSVMYPFWGKQVKVTPDFEQRILRGSLFIKGRVRAVHFASLALNVFLSSAVRKTYKDIKNFRG